MKGLLAAHQTYLSVLPEGRHRDESGAAAWRAVEQTVGGTRELRTKLAACVDYLTVMPEGSHAEEARERAWQETSRAATRSLHLKGKIDAYRTYLETFAGGRNAAEAGDAVWQVTRAEDEARTALGDKLSAVAQYLAAFPQGAHVQQAQERAWAITKQAVAEAPDLKRKLDAYGTYVASIPGAAKAGEAGAAAWQTVEAPARSSQDIKTQIMVYETYQAAFPNGDHAAEAKDEADWLRTQAVVDAATAADEKLRAYRAYLSTHPNGAHAIEARGAPGELAWLRARATVGAASAIDDKLKGYDAYLSAFENGAHAAEATSAVEALRFRQMVVVPDSTTDQYGNPVVTRNGSRTDPRTGQPYEIWLKSPRVEFVLVPAGEFMMGDMGTTRQVRLTQPFYLAKYEITQAQWRAVMGGRPWSRQRHVKSDGRNPAVHISWGDCQGFLEKLGRGLRLPTEAEWEYACRAGSTTAYCFGDGVSPLEDYAWYYDPVRDNASDADVTHAHGVGLKKPNAWGLYDMHGNVWEWCQNCGIRGGCFGYHAQYCCSAYRDRLAPGNRDATVGFRPVRPLP